MQQWANESISGGTTFHCPFTTNPHSLKNSSVPTLVFLLLHVLHELLVLQGEPDGLVLLVDLVGAVHETESGHAEEREDACAERLPNFAS